MSNTFGLTEDNQFELELANKLNISHIFEFMNERLIRTKNIDSQICNLLFMVQTPMPSQRFVF